MTAPQGSRGARVRSLLTMVAVVTVFSWLGGLVSGHPWPAVAVIPAVAALGAAVPRVGSTATLCTLVAALRPPTSPAVFNGLLETVGGVWISALLLTFWLAHRLGPRRPVSPKARDRSPAPSTRGRRLRPGAGRCGSRVRAYAALRSARIACGLYRSGGHVDQRWPVRFVVAVDQVMDRAVALHSLCVRPGALARAATAGRVRGRGHRRGHAAARARRRDRDGYRPAARRAGGEPGPGLRQAIGTTAGTAGTAGALALAPGRITLLVLIFVSGAIGLTLRSVSTGYWIRFGTPMTMLLIDSTAPLNWTAGLLRITVTLAGALLALVFARLLFRAGTQQRIDDRLARLLRAHADLAWAIAERPERGGAPVRAADRAAAAAEADLDRLAGRVRSPREERSRLFEASRIARRVRNDLNALAAEDSADPVNAITRRIADRLDRGADAVAGHDEAGPPAPVVGEHGPYVRGDQDTVRTLVADTERLRSLTTARRLGPGGRQRA